MEEATIRDEELLIRLRNNNEEALAILYRRYWEVLFRKAYALLKDEPACEDIIQEIFVRIWNNRHSLVITASLAAYLSASVRYEVIRKIKAGKFMRMFLPPWPINISKSAARSRLNKKN